MSTFKGFIKEFPQIRIDYFRRDDKHPPALACFLSHVHTDHLVGLEYLKSPFVYCSLATKEILLRLEKYPARMNFAKGILETRTQTFRHLKPLLKPIPLEAPTVIELSPNNEIKVTLFDANHCIGAVMFLIEGGGANAILYTGDIRAEPWWISSLTRSPALIPYACGLKRLSNIYLDTTFAIKSQPYQEFPSKMAGIRELLEKLGRYPADTMFSFESWTFGYEDVWMAMSTFLDSQIHLNEYRYNLYNSIPSSHSRESAQLGGYMMGNHTKAGCITRNENVRIHTCERGFQCSAVLSHNRVVNIIPVVTRDQEGNDVQEIGAGGGKGDLNQAQELEMHDATVLDNLIALCSSNVKDRSTLERIKMLITASHNSVHARVRLASCILLKYPFRNEGSFSGGKQMLPIETQETEETEISLNRVVDQLSSMVQESKHDSGVGEHEITDDLPRTITFPYSRHSSYNELCQLVAAFQPRSVYPCTVDESRWTTAVSMVTLFGEYCAPGAAFDHDEEMLEKYDEESQQSEYTELAIRSQTTEFVSSPAQQASEDHSEDNIKAVSDAPIPLATPSKASEGTREKQKGGPRPNTADRKIKAEDEGWEEALTTKRKAALNQEDANQRPTIKRNKSIQEWAYGAATGLDPECPDWEEFGGLVCTRKTGTSFEFRSNVRYDEEASQERVQESGILP